jgi:hypothetical protein
MQFPTTPFDTDRAKRLPGRVNGGPVEALIAVNVVRKKQCLQFLAPMFAVHYKY